MTWNYNESTLWHFPFLLHNVPSPLRGTPFTLQGPRCRRSISVLNRRKSAWQIRSRGISSHWLPGRYSDLIQEVCDFFVSSRQLSTTIACLSKCTVKLIVPLWKNSPRTLRLHHRLWNVRPPKGGKGPSRKHQFALSAKHRQKTTPWRKHQSNNFFVERTSGCRFYNSFNVYQQARILCSLVIKSLKKAYGSACHGNECLKGQMFLEQPLRQMALSGSVPHDLICYFSFKCRGTLKSPSLKFTPT